jgi:hypothetical protein
LWFWNVCLSLFDTKFYSPGMWKCSLVLIPYCQLQFYFLLIPLKAVILLFWCEIFILNTVWCNACNPVCKLSSEFAMTTWSCANNKIFNCVIWYFYSCSAFFIPPYDDLIHTHTHTHTHTYIYIYMYIYIYNVGDKGQPCLTPWIITFFFVVLLLILIPIVLFV